MKCSWHFRVVVFSIAVILFVSRALAFQAAAPVSQAPEMDLKPKANVFFAFGDTRFTDPAHCDLSNPGFRTAIIDRIARSDEKPDFLVMTGDIVYRGDNDHDWKIFDDETKPLKDEKIPVFPVLGNHDVRGTSGQSKFVEHFDELKSHDQLKTQTWYSVNYANAQLLMLDSQSSYDEHSPQGEWLRKKLKSVPEGLAFLFVVLHHPVVTHASRIPFVYHCGGKYAAPAVGHDVEDAEKALKFLLEDFAKTHPSVHVIVLSGHNHNYERYIVNGITYIVTAGGGATPYRISRRRSDLYHEPGPTFHYCRFVLHDHSLTGEMYKVTLQNGAAHWQRADQFELNASTDRK